MFDFAVTRWKKHRYLGKGERIAHFPFPGEMIASVLWRVGHLPHLPVFEVALITPHFEERGVFEVAVFGRAREVEQYLEKLYKIMLDIPYSC